MKKRFDNYKFVEVERKGVPTIEVSNLEETWLVRIPAHYEMYNILKELLGRDDDESAKEVLRMLLLNFQVVTSLPNGYFHQAIMLLNVVYTNPKLLTSSRWSKEKRAFMKDVETLRSNFISWSKEYQKLLDRARVKVDDTQEEAADYAKQVLEGKEE